MKKVYIGIAVIAILALGLAGGRLFRDNGRSKYPYTGISVSAEDAAFMDEYLVTQSLAEKFEGLDRYSGETLEQFSEKVDELSDGIKSK